ncbi:MAG: hypothetical protein HC906_14010 [Bacteroidales bacterium]|nr:hypothetical protein [Bacteroidales bacterium]
MESFPVEDSLIQKAKILGDYMVKLKNSGSPEEDYTGPVIIEDHAVVRLFAKSVFGNEMALIAEREALKANAETYSSLKKKTTIDSKLEKRVMPKEFSVYEFTQINHYNDKIMGQLPDRRRRYCAGKYNYIS